jgi:hypothetical protein
MDVMFSPASPGIGQGLEQSDITGWDNGEDVLGSKGMMKPPGEEVS